MANGSAKRFERVRQLAGLRFPLRFKLALGIAAPLAVLAIGLNFVSFYRASDAAKEAARRRGATLTTVIAGLLRSSVDFDDASGAQEILETLAAESDLVYATVRRGDGTVLSAWQGERDPGMRLRPGEIENVTEQDQGAHFTRQIGPETGPGPNPQAQKPRATVHVGLSYASMYEELSRSLQVSVWLSIGIVVVGLLLGLGMGALLARPIVTLSHYSRQVVGAGDLTQQLTLDTSDEVGILADSFRQMTDSQRSILLALKRSADALTEISGRLITTGETTAAGATTIQTRVVETSSAMAAMGGSLRDVATSVDVLLSAAESGSTSVAEMAKGNQDVADKIVTMAAAVDDTSSAITEMATSARETAHSIEELDVAIQQTSSTIREMQGSITEVERNVASTADLAEQTARNAERGGTAIDETLQGIAEIKEASSAVSGTIDVLAGAVKDIDEIILVIGEVTARTNLLALNAAIIAAQAGEQGRAFAVVADEVKNLADRTQLSTKEISELIHKVQAETKNALAAVARGMQSVDRGVVVGRRAEDALRQIVASAGQSSQMVQLISTATREQGQASKRVTSALQRISGSVQQIRVASGEQAKGAEQIAASAERMRELTNQARSSTEKHTHNSSRAVGSIAEMSRMVRQTQSAQRAQSLEAERSLRAVREIGTATTAQQRSFAEVEAAIAAVRQQVQEFQRTMARFRI